MKSVSRAIIAIVLAACFMTAAIQAEVRVPHVIGSNMVVLRDKPVPVWGWADPCEEVSVDFDEFHASTKADPAGKWKLSLPAMKAGGPSVMTIRGESNTLRFTNILVGEVWICSGQSNMEVGLGYLPNGRKEIEEANWPEIRLFQLPLLAAAEPSSDTNAVWVECRPRTISRLKPWQKEKSAGDWGGFSAVGYYFGRELHKQLGVPVGMIDTSWGGTRTEAWSSLWGAQAGARARRHCTEGRGCARGVQTDDAKRIEAA